MNILKYSLEYYCYPIWHYDEDGELIDNDLPEGLSSDKELDSLLLKIQELFDGLFVDTDKEFSCSGFRTEEERQNFLALLFSSVNILQQRYGTNYLIECRYNERSFPIGSLEN